jgi:hypothetical protein
MQEKTLSHKIYLKNKIANLILKIEAKMPGRSFGEIHPALASEIDQALESNNTPKLQVIVEKLDKLI